MLPAYWFYKYALLWFASAGMRKESWITDDGTDYGSGVVTPSPSAESPVHTLGSAPAVMPAPAVVAGASPARLAARRKTMRADDGISRLLHRQSMFQAAIDVGTLRGMADPDDIMAELDAALDDAMSVTAPDDDDYMNEHGELVYRDCLLLEFEAMCPWCL